MPTKIEPFFQLILYLTGFSNHVPTCFKIVHLKHRNLLKNEKLLLIEFDVFIFCIYYRIPVRSFPSSIDSIHIPHHSIHPPCLHTTKRNIYINRIAVLRTILFALMNLDTRYIHDGYDGRSKMRIKTHASPFEEVRCIRRKSQEWIQSSGTK